MFMCGLVLLYLLVWKEFSKLNSMVGIYSHQSHDWPRVYFVVFPKLLDAQICTGSQVFQALQIHLEELKAGGSTISYWEIISAVMYTMYYTLIWYVYIQTQICISNLLYNKYYYSAVRFVFSLILFSCDLLLLLFY